MAGTQLYERVHYRHDAHWLLPVLDDGEAPLCLACIIEMMEDETVSVVRKKHMLSHFQEYLEKNSSTIVELLLHDARICTHFIQQLLGMLINTEDNTASVLVTKVLVQVIVDLKQEEFVHCTLDGCQKELSAVASMRLSLPVFSFMGKLIDAMPNVAEIFVTDHYSLVEELPHGLMYPNEALKATVCYLYGKLYSSPTSTKKLSVHFADKLCKLLLATLENAQTKELQINSMGLLKQLLNYDHFVPVIMNTSVRLEESEGTPTLQAQNPLPLLLKKILLSREEFLQIASAQCIAAILVLSPASYAPEFIHADIPEFLFENLLSRSEVLIWSIYCCLLLMTEERLFFTKGHTAYGIEAVLRSIGHILQFNNKELQKQGLLLLIEILNRQPIEIKLFTNPGMFKAAVGVLQEAMNSSILEVAIEGTRATSAFLRKNHLSIPVQYGDLERLICKMLDCCADLPITPIKRKKSVNRDGIKRGSRYGQLLTNTLEGFHSGCKLAMDCQSDFTAQNNAFTAPSSKSNDTLETFTWFLLKTCDTVCIPIVLKYYEHMPGPATMETFFSMLNDIFKVVPSMKETFSVKLASTSFIRLSMDVKSTLCSGQRNSNLNNACSIFLTHLCFTLWQLKAGGINDSQKAHQDPRTLAPVPIRAQVTLSPFQGCLDQEHNGEPSCYFGLHTRYMINGLKSPVSESADSGARRALCTPHRTMPSQERQMQTTGDERRAPAEGPDPGGAKALGPGVPIRGIRMKFAVLSGLLEVGEVSTRDLEDTVFNLLAHLLKHLFFTEVYDILNKSMPHIEGSRAETLSVLLESSDTHTTEDFRCHQQALIFIACVAYLTEDRFIPEMDLFWAVLAFLHSVQSQQYILSSCVTRASLYLLACCQDKCKAMNMMSVNLVCRLLENISEIRLVYFHHPLFLKFFFRYSQLLEKYGSQILELWIHQEESSFVSEENPNLVPPLHDNLKPDLINSGSEELADKGLLILKSYIHENDSFDASDLLLNRLLRILQDIVVLRDVKVEKKLPLILNLLCLAQQKDRSDSEMDGTYFKLLYHATAMLLSNNSFIELVDKIMEYIWDETKTYPDELFGSLCCSALLITSSLIYYQQLYTLQVHKTVHVDVHKIVNVISCKYKSTSSKLMISLLHLFKALLRHQFSSPLLLFILTKESEQSTPETEESIKPLTTQNTLYLAAAIQNLLIQLVKYGSLNILMLDEIKQIIDEAAKLKLLELPSYTVLDLQIFLHQLLSKNLAIEPSKRYIVQDILHKIVDIQKASDSRSALYPYALFLKAIFRLC
ncbi:meiosis inhibitor protein 1 [Mantella aurantiaca]